MRRLIFAAALAAFSLACRKATSPATIEGPGEPLVFLRSADPKAAPQFVKGFYSPEQNAWRWTASQFSVKLRPPFGSSQNGARLRMNLTIPDPIIQRVNPITLSASIGAMKLDPQTFSKAGAHTYIRDVSPGVLLTETITIDFALDKFLAAGVADQRELGIIVSAVGLERK